jgi:FkbH-like protein
LSDIFGDNGMISVVVCREIDAKSWEIDTWLMSCRVLGRRVQEMVLIEIIRQGAQRGIERLVGSYIPTERNKMVEGHYRGLGFELVSEDAGGGTTWELDTRSAVVAGAPMKVKSIGFELVQA